MLLGGPLLACFPPHTTASSHNGVVAVVAIISSFLRRCPPLFARRFAEKGDLFREVRLSGGFLTEQCAPAPPVCALTQARPLLLAHATKSPRPCCRRCARGVVAPILVALSYMHGEGAAPPPPLLPPSRHRSPRRPTLAVFLSSLRHPSALPPQASSTATSSPRTSSSTARAPSSSPTSACPSTAAWSGR